MAKQIVANLMLSRRPYTLVIRNSDREPAIVLVDKEARTHVFLLMGLLEAGRVVLRDALRILGVLRLGACVVCSRFPAWVEG